MRANEAAGFRHPLTHESLNIRIGEVEDTEVLSGSLVAENGNEFRVVRGIPRFCPEENYAENFGYQWQFYSATQLDSKTRFENRTENRLFQATNWPRDLTGQRILEAGSGMGRFTEILATAGAEVSTFDFSIAIDANRDNNKHFDNVSFAQEDIYTPPYEPESFDKVICLGVLQHCPSPKRAFMSLTRFIKPGGEICVDSYPLSWKCLFLGKYYIRPVTRLLPAETLHRFVRFHVGWIFPMTGWLYKRVGRPASVLSWSLAVADFRQHVDADEETLKELSMLDTLDMLAPSYDRPKTVWQVRRWCEEAGLEGIEVFRNVNVIARAKKPVRT